MNKKTKIIISSIIAVLLIAAGIISYIYNMPANRISRTLDLAKSLIAEENWEEAKIQLNKVIEIDATNVEAHIMLADVYMKQDDTENAIIVYKKLIELVPERPETYLDCAQIYVNHGKWEEAKNILQLGVDNTGDQRIKDKLAEVEQKIAEIEEAERKAKEEAAEKLRMQYIEDIGLLRSSSIKCVNNLKLSQRREVFAPIIDRAIEYVTNTGFAGKEVVCPKCGHKITEDEGYGAINAMLITNMEWEKCKDYRRKIYSLTDNEYFNPSGSTVIDSGVWGPDNEFTYYFETTYDEYGRDICTKDENEIITEEMIYEDNKRIFIRPDETRTWEFDDEGRYCNNYSTDVYFKQKDYEYFDNYVTYKSIYGTEITKCKKTFDKYGRAICNEDESRNKIDRNKLEYCICGEYEYIYE